MGEEIGDNELARFEELAAAMEREFGELVDAGEESDAAHG
jgi:hypothetical protein